MIFYVESVMVFTHIARMLLQKPAKFLSQKCAILYLFSVLLTISQALSQVVSPEGFTALFNGRDLSGWQGFETMDPRAFNRLNEAEKSAKLEKDQANAIQHWTVEKGELVNDGEGVFLSTKKDYEDIELLIEYKTVARADSGIYLRGTPQVQIWDFTDEEKFELGSDKGSGGLWNNTEGKPGKDPLVFADKPFGEWNQFRIIQVGNRTTVFLNGELVVDHAIMENYWNYDLPLIEKGPIQLQTHGGEIRWRNIFVREIPEAEANEIMERGTFSGAEN